MKTLCALVLLLGGAFLGGVGMFAPMAELSSPGGTPLFRLLMELAGMANLLAGIVVTVARL